MHSLVPPSFCCERGLSCSSFSWLIQLESSCEVRIKALFSPTHTPRCPQTWPAASDADHISPRACQGCKRRVKKGRTQTAHLKRVATARQLGDAPPDTGALAHDMLRRGRSNPTQPPDRNRTLSLLVRIKIPLRKNNILGHTGAP